MARVAPALLGLALAACGAAPPLDPDGGAAGPGTSGWDDPVGAGAVGAVPWLQIMAPTEGLDLDGRCPADACADNRLGIVAEPLMTTRAPTGDTWLIELAGLDDPVEDPEVTVKLYRRRFVGQIWSVAPADLDAGGQARARLPARVRAGVLETIGPAHVGPRPAALTQGGLPLEQARLRIELLGGIGGTRRLVLGGVVRVGSTKDAAPPGQGSETNPFSSLLDFLARTVGSPDIDLDGDGLERLTWQDGQLTCYDGCDVRCPAPLPLPAPDPEDALSCATLPAMADGWSVAFIGDLVPIERS